jgi:hypothetical protein
LLSLQINYPEIRDYTFSRNTGLTRFALRRKMEATRALWRLAYGLIVLAFYGYALTGYPSAMARYTGWWSGGIRLSPLDHRQLMPAVIYAIERNNVELKVLVLRTYAEPAAENIAVRLKIFNIDGSESFFVFRERIPPGRLAVYTVHAPLAVRLHIEIEVDGTLIVEERMLEGP